MTIMLHTYLQFLRVAVSLKQEGFEHPVQLVSGLGVLSEVLHDS